MNNTKSTRRALLLSIMAMLLCVVLLVGTTFVWFSDSASTGVNKIQAGTLDVQLLDASGNSLEGQTLKWQKAAGHESDEVLWEPGCTYNTQQFYIKNNGNLNLKFKFSVSGITGDAKLLEVLDFTARADASWFKFNTGAISIATSGEFDLLKGYDVDTLFYGTMHFDEYVLEPGEKVGPIVISGHMAESAGNEYQGESIDGIAITLVATQATGEEDSYNGTYDENAEYPAIVSEIATKYKADASMVPAGFVVEEKSNTAHDGTNNITGTITIHDAESLLYFAYVLDPAAAYQKHRSDRPEEWSHTCIWYPGATARHIKLAADIDLANIVLPNGFGNMKDFDFDGQGHTIKNVTIRNSGNINIGLFQGRNRGISDLVVENVNVILTGATGDSAVGIVSSDASAKISDVTVKNSSVTGGKWTGGIVGYNYGDVINCTMENCIVSGQYKVGGVVGYVCGPSREITGNKLTNVTVKGENILSGKTLAIGKIVGNWNATAGNCKNNTFIGTTTATANIGLILNTVNQD